MEGSAIAAEAETWIGTPFHWQGRIRAGCDCKGLVAGVFAGIGRPEATSVEALAGDYSTRIDEGRLHAGLARLFDRVAQPAAGDVLLLLHGGKAQHLGIALDARTMVHAIDVGPRQVVRAAIGRGRLVSSWRVREARQG